MSMVTPHLQRTVVSMVWGAVGASRTRRRVHHKANHRSRGAEALGGLNADVV